MDIFFKILWCILNFAFGGCVGAYIVLKYLEKSTDDLINTYRAHSNKLRELIDKQNGLIELQHGVIKNRCELINLYEQAFREIHDGLIKTRDDGVDNLNDLIGFVGHILEELNASDKEENSHDDHTG